MKRIHGLPFGIAVLTAMFTLTLAGCATASSIGGTADTHGLFGKGTAVAEGGEEIASYSVILGLIDSKYPEYAAAVQEAQAAGKKITTVTKWMVFLTKTTAYANAKVTVAPPPPKEEPADTSAPAATPAAPAASTPAASADAPADTQ